MLPKTELQNDRTGFKHHTSHKWAEIIWYWLPADTWTFQIFVSSNIQFYCKKKKYKNHMYFKNHGRSMKSNHKLKKSMNIIQNSKVMPLESKIPWFMWNKVTKVILTITCKNSQLVLPRQNQKQPQKLKFFSVSFWLDTVIYTAFK